MSRDKPECSKWQVWLGKEIEGIQDLGEMTLFVRSDEWLKSDHLVPDDVSRVWFCYEYIVFLMAERRWDTIVVAHNMYKRVCLEVDPFLLNLVPEGIRNFSKIYLRLGLLPLKEGDHISYGMPYEEAYLVVTKDNLVKTKKPQYGEDKRLV